MDDTDAFSEYPARMNENIRGPFHTLARRFNIIPAWACNAHRPHYHTSHERDTVMTCFDTVRNNFVGHMVRATFDQRIAARMWYYRAQDFARTLIDRRPEWSLEVASSVISAYSPRTRWVENKAKAILHAAGERPRGLGAHYAAARLAETEGFNALRGMKTNAFARAISGDMDAVVIDSWMMKASGIDRDAPTIRQYREFGKIIREIAPEYWMSPAEAQALIWIVQRGSAE